MRKSIQFVGSFLCFCFVAGFQAEARVTINDVNLSSVQGDTSNMSNMAFHFEDGAIKCVGTFRPSVSLDCNHHPASRGVVASYADLKPEDPGPIQVYENVIRLMPSETTYSHFTVNTTEIEVQLIDHQVCYFARKTANRVSSVDTSCVPL